MLGNIVGGQLPVFGRYTWRQFVTWLDAGDDVSLTPGGSLQEDRITPAEDHPS